MRVSLLAAVSAVLAAMRTGSIPTPVPVAIWPILGSMFVFRLVVYLYDLRHQTAPVSITCALSYFFMLPNVCFPLFPVVDYQSFSLNHYNKDSFKIYQVGVCWLFRGVLHLILYRVLYKEWSISAYDVANAGDLVHYCLLAVSVVPAGLRAVPHHRGDAAPVRLQSAGDPPPVLLIE